MISRGGKPFYGCTGYPECKFMSWDMPTGEKCPICNNFIVEVDGKKQCSDKKCKFNEQ